MTVACKLCVMCKQTCVRIVWLLALVVLLLFIVGMAYESHVDQLAPSVRDLAMMEQHAQSMFLKMHSGQWLAR